MKHTKGPWQVINKREICLINKNNTPIGDTYCECEQTQCEECEANAKLMAAAPEMLELLKDINFELSKQDYGLKGTELDELAVSVSLLITKIEKK